MDRCFCSAISIISSACLSHLPSYSNCWFHSNWNPHILFLWLVFFTYLFVCCLLVSAASSLQDNRVSLSGRNVKASTAAWCRCQEGAVRPPLLMTCVNASVTDDTSTIDQWKHSELWTRRHLCLNIVVNL